MKPTAGRAAATAALLTTANYAFAAGSDVLKIGLIGCGGRGTNAIDNIMEADSQVQVTALADAFGDQVQNCRLNIAKYGDRTKVKDEHCFSGIDAYKKLLATDVDYVILATPPGYRPLHLRAAIEAGKHVFAEKPIATCPTGIRSVFETAKLAETKKLGIVAGTQRRHEGKYVETIKRIHDGAIGEILTGQIYWLQGGIWAKERRPEYSDTEWMLRNWQYFTALGGDHIVEQHVHNIDVMCWVMNAHPVKVTAMGGRQGRIEPIYGHIYDHFGAEFEFANGVRITSLSRQCDGCVSRVTENFTGTRGVTVPAGSIRGSAPFRYEGRDQPYVQEHKDLIASIRAGKPLNEGATVATSTLAAIMARMSAYTGQEVTWEQAMNSRLDLRPDNWTMGPRPVPPVVIPGKEPLI
jgi:predicted dehydrogenase